MNLKTLWSFIDVACVIFPVFGYNMFMFHLIKKIVTDDGLDEKQHNKYILYLSIFSTFVVLLVFQDSFRNIFS